VFPCHARKMSHVCKDERTLTDETTGNQVMTIWPFIPLPVIFGDFKLGLELQVH